MRTLATEVKAGSSTFSELYLAQTFRRTMVLGLVVLMTASGAAQEFPDLRAGLWELRSSLDEGSGTSSVVWTLRCVDPREEMHRRKESLEAEGCNVQPVVHVGSLYVLTAECRVRDYGDRRVESTVSVASDSAYYLHWVERVNGKANGEVLTATRAGDC